MEAVIYIGHGTRTEAGIKAFISFIEPVLEKTEANIREYAFLERAEPTILQAIEKCAAKGAEKIVIVPVLLMPGIHANVEIPEWIEKGQTKFPDIKMIYGEPLGTDALMLDIIEEKLWEKGYRDEEDSEIILVGHGSTDEVAHKEFIKLANLYRETKAAQVEVGYAMTEPSYKGLLEKKGQSNSKKVFVVPYFLFVGGFVSYLNDTIAEYQDKFPGTDIILTEGIGFHENVETLLLKRFQETVSSSQVGK